MLSARTWRSWDIDKSCLQGRLEGGSSKWSQSEEVGEGIVNVDDFEVSAEGREVGWWR